MTPRRKIDKEQLPHWLWRMVDSEACPGVRWLNKAQRSFKIPWINQKNSQWNEVCAQLFAEYAKYKGKLQNGGEIDYPTCKQNFKSAVGKSKKALTCQSKTKMFRIYRFEADYSSRNDREDGHYQQTRSESSVEGVDGLIKGIGASTQKLDDAGTSQVSTEQLSLVRINSGGESSAADLHQDLSEVLFGDADGMEKSRFCLEPLQGSCKLADLDNPDEVLTTLGVSIDSLIQNTTVDSTTGICGGSVEFPDGGLGLTANSQAQSDDVHGDIAEINTELTNSNVSMAGCTIVQMDEKSTQLLLSQLGIPRHQTIPCNTPGFPNSSMDVTNNQFDVSLDNPSLQSLTNSLSSMEISEQDNNQMQAEAALPTSVSSSTDSETTIPQPETLSSASTQEPRLMVIQIMYSSPLRVVKKEIITSNKCKIFFGRVDNRRLQEAIDKKDEGAVLVELPTVDESNFKDPSKTRIEKTLERMEQGVVISYRDNGDIYVTRRCQSKVFLTDGVSTSDSVPRSRMKEPDQEVKAFDFAMFEKSINNHKTKTGCMGRDHFILTLGCEILKNDPNPTRVVPIRIDVLHLKCANMRFETLGKDAFLPDPQHSLSDSFDTQVHLSNAPF